MTQKKTGTERAPGGPGPRSAVPVTCWQPLGDGEVRFEPSSARISPEDEQIISTWAKGERGGEGEGCQRGAAVQIPPDSSPAAPTPPVIPQNKLQSKQGTPDPAVAAARSSLGRILTLLILLLLLRAVAFPQHGIYGAGA